MINAHKTYGALTTLAGFGECAEPLSVQDQPHYQQFIWAVARHLLQHAYTGSEKPDLVYLHHTIA